MAQIKHSKGEWKAVIDDARKTHRMAMVDTGAGKCIDCTGSGKTFAESAANARLCAAAPRLEEALRAMLEMFEAVGARVDWGTALLRTEEIRLMNEAPIAAHVALKAAGME